MNDKKSRFFFAPIIAALGLVTLILPHETHAQDWIVGGAIGVAKQQDYSVAGPVASRDDTDTALSVFGGYTFGPIHGVLVSYLDLGTVTYSGPAFGGFAESLDADGIDVSYMARWSPGDQERIALLGTAGIFSWTQDVTYTDSTGAFRYGDNGQSLSLGIGAHINFSAEGTSAWAIHASYKYLRDVGDSGNSGHENDRDVISIGVAYRFRRD